MALQIQKLTKAVSQTTTSGVLTVDDTTPIWPGQIGHLSKAGVTTVRIQVVEVVSSTTFRARFLPATSDAGFGSGLTTSSMFGDLSAFAGGSASFSADSQVVGTGTDGGKLVVA
jgi:hypothetical protein